MDINNYEEEEKFYVVNVQLQSEKFDGLADDYNRYRPRCPLTLFETMFLPFKKGLLSIVDVGAGTGVA